MFKIFLEKEKFIGTGFSLTFTWITSVLIARGLSLEDRGLFGEILFFSSLILLLFCPPVFEYLSSEIKKIKNFNDSSSNKIELIYFHLLLICPSMIMVGIFFIDLLNDLPNQFFIFAIALSQVITSSLQFNYYSLVGYKKSYYILLFGQILNLVGISLFFITKSISLSFVVYLSILQFLVVGIIYFFLSSKEFNILSFKSLLVNGYFFYIKNFKKILNSWLAIILFVAYSSLTRLILTDNVSNADLGLFFTAYQIILTTIGVCLVIYKPVIFSSSTLFISKELSLNEYSKNIFITILGTIILYLFINFLGYEIFIFMYGAKFADVIYFWNFLCLSIFFFNTIGIMSVISRGLGIPNVEISSFLFFITIFLTIYVGFFNFLEGFDGLDFINKIYYIEILSLISTNLLMLALLIKNIKNV